MVKKSKGFSWGPAATGCSYWTGVRMSTLLRMARADGHEKVLSCGLPYGGVQSLHVDPSSGGAPLGPVAHVLPLRRAPEDCSPG